MSTFEEKIKLKELFLMCPKCQNKVKIQWKELKEFLETPCKCGNGILLTKDDYNKMREFENDVITASEEDSFDFDEFVDDFFIDQPKGKFKTDGKGTLEIEIDDGITDDERNL